MQPSQRTSDGPIDGGHRQLCLELAHASHQVIQLRLLRLERVSKIGGLCLLCLQYLAQVGGLCLLCLQYLAQVGGLCLLCVQRCFQATRVTLQASNFLFKLCSFLPDSP